MCGEVPKSAKKCPDDFALQLLPSSFSLNLRGSFWAGYPCAHPAKNFGQALQILGKDSHFGTDMLCGCPRKDFGLINSGCATGAAKVSCRETVVQKGVFGESVSFLPLKVFFKTLKCPENLKGAEKKRTLQNTLLDNLFSPTTPSPLPLGRPHKLRDDFPFPTWWIADFFNSSARGGEGGDRGAGGGGIGFY